MADIEIRSAGSLAASGTKLAGYAAVFGVEAALPGFHEIIRPGAFTRSLASGVNIRALADHETSKLLGTTQAGTLELREDDHGLAFSVDLPDTGYGRDLGVLVRRGDISGCSFGFTVGDAGQSWIERDGGDWLRELRDLDLAEITVTAAPAYPNTSVALRSRPSVYERSDWRNLWLETCR